MSDTENSPAEVLRAQHDPDGRLARENADLRARLAAMENANVVRGPGDAPRYLLNEPGFYDDTYWVAGTSIEYTDTPNLTMVPLNEPAKRAMAIYIDHLETGARRLAAKNGRDFYGLVTDRNVLIDMARDDAKATADAAVPVIKVPQPIGQVPAMPHTDEARAAARRGPGRPRTVVASLDPAPVQRPGPDQSVQMLAPAPREEPAVVGRMVR